MKLLHLVLILLLILPSVSSIEYFTDRMNFPPGESRIHRIDVTNDGNSTVTVNITVPGGFAASGGSCAYPISGLYQCVMSAGQSLYATVTSPSNCTEGAVYYANLTGSNNLSARLMYVCIPDSKITDCKVEYGHGDGNYLSANQLYISNETATIFNLVRVWNIGHYLTPNEDAKNVSINCTYENFPISTYGRVEITHGTSDINGSFWWDVINGGYWFRIGVVSQQVSGMSINDYYNVSCSEVNYRFNHYGVIANASDCSLEIRTQEPFTCNLTAHPTLSGKSILTITNNESYNTYGLSFDRLLDGTTHDEEYQQLNSGRSVSYVVDSTPYNYTVFFIPSWYANSFSPTYYKQQLGCVPAGNYPPVLGPIGNHTIYVNETFVFDANATDPDNDNLTFYDNATIFDINNITGIFNFTPNQTGNYSVNISVCDNSSCDWEVIWIYVINLTPMVSCNLTSASVNTLDNKSIDLTWTDANADSYVIQWSNDPNNFTNATTAGSTANLSYTDNTANQSITRYYRIVATKAGNNLTCGMVGCKHSYYFISNSDTTKGRNYLTLVCNTTYTAERFLQDVPGHNATYITQLNRWNNPELENYESHPLGSSVNNFTMDLGKGYLLFTTKNVSMTTAGFAIYNPVTLSMISNADTTKGRNYVGLPYTVTGHTAESFISAIASATYITQLNRWNNPEIENYQSHPKSSTVNNFPMDNRGRGYLIFVTLNETYTPS